MWSQGRTGQVCKSHLSSTASDSYNDPAIVIGTNFRFTFCKIIASLYAKYNIMEIYTEHEPHNSKEHNAALYLRSSAMHQGKQK